MASDPVLWPWESTDLCDPVQTGAWILPDERPLSAELEAFLDAGEPPVYFGFGSIRAPQDLSQVMIDRPARSAAVRSCRAAGPTCHWWTTQPDCLAIGEVNQQALFKRVAAVVHHGGAGTTTTAALAGAPQVVIPQMYDQHYWAGSVPQLGIGAAHARPHAHLRVADSGARARATAETAHARRSWRAAIRSDGATAAAKLLLDAVNRGRGSA